MNRLPKKFLQDRQDRQDRLLLRLVFSAVLAVVAVGVSAAPEDRVALYGDLHVHTGWSFDSYIFGNNNTPDDAYRFARGEVIQHPEGFDMRLRKPLDFLAVTDHATYLGMLPAMFDENSSVAEHPLSEKLRNAESVTDRLQIFRSMADRFLGNAQDDDLLDVNIVTDTWRQILESAEKHNSPGIFTSLIGYEFTASRDYGNLHRNVIFAGDIDQIPEVPFSRIDGGNDPRKLWDWMDEVRAREGADVLAIPHNSNGSNGHMFALEQFDGTAFDLNYIEKRRRNEPLVEVTQVKGTSETHPDLSPNDEWADFEIMTLRIGTFLESKPEGSYVREAYRNGLKIKRDLGQNPFDFGLVGASDSHVAAGSFEEEDFWSKIGVVDASARLRGSIPLTFGQRMFFWWQDVWVRFQLWRDEASDIERGLAVAPERLRSPGYRAFPSLEWGASGLTGVWAEENTREAIFDAFRRKETFATTGPRIALRFFASFRYSEPLVRSTNFKRLAYRLGVPMGSTLERSGTRIPGFLVWAVRDPHSAGIERVQIVKGWIDEKDVTHERVYDVACAGGGQVDDTTHRCTGIPEVTIDSDTCQAVGYNWDLDVKAYWRDPDFKPEQNAFYYARVLEQPSCRWSKWDAVKAGENHNPLLPEAIQERAWSSPIWYKAF